MFGFFERDEETSKLIIKGLKGENKTLVTQVKDLQKSATRTAEQTEDRIHSINRRHSQELTEVKDDAREEVREAQRDADDKVREAEDNASEEVRDAEKAADARVRLAEGKVQVTDLAVKKAVLEEREKHSSAETKLEVAIAVANGKASAEAARADAAESLVESIEGLLEDANDNHSDFTKLILAKIAEVKLDKFAINVEMPSPEVTVISNGGGNKGGGDNQGKK